MSRLASSFVFGFHGCDRTVGLRALLKEEALIPSDRAHDWLGPGIYFWESDPDRALEWAQAKAAREEYKEPFVIGAVIDLGNCLDLLIRENLELLSWSYNDFAARQEKAGLPLPQNKDTKAGLQGDKLLRLLDCAVIRNLHDILAEQPPEGFPEIGEYIEPFDTVRGMFTEGGEVYAGGGFYNLTHTQISVRNEDCIKGIFLPR